MARKVEGSAWTKVVLGEVGSARWWYWWWWCMVVVFAEGEAMRRNGENGEYGSCFIGVSKALKPALGFEFVENLVDEVLYGAMCFVGREIVRL